jgi:4-hydroxy-tetrahydrodipicolinate reductase
MGQAIAASLATHDDLLLASLWVRDPHTISELDLPENVVIGDDVEKVAAAADVVIDFSLPEATGDVLAAVTSQGKPLVCGVSGLTRAQTEALDAAAESVAVVYDRNMSPGIAVLEGLVRQAAAMLGDEFAVEVHETHHVHKLDAPSGTALKLGEAVAAARGMAPEDIQYEVERRGEVPGEHTVFLSTPNERLSLGHSVTTRQVFADGAIRAARWVIDQPPGRYTMQDVLRVVD